jgi:very-short-patch-repair endonuclease
MMVGCVSTEWLVAALDAALHTPRNGRPLLDGHAFARLARLLPTEVLQLIDPLAESCLETLLRLGMLGRGITGVVAQAVPHPAFRVDFLLQGWLIIEADGAAFHDPERDRIRDAELRALGYVVLRFDYDRIVFDLEAVLDEIEAALTSRDGVHG